MPKKQTKKKTGKTIAELSREYGRSLHAIRSICGQLVPVGKDGNSNLYNPKQVAAAVSKQIPRNKKSDETVELEKRKLELQCKKLENELDIQLRHLLPVDEVTKNISILVQSVRSHLLSMPAKVAPLIVGHPEHKVQKILKEHHLKCLEKLQNTKFE